MKTTTLTLVLTLVPAALVAQATGQGSGQGSASAEAKKGSLSAGAAGQSQTSADGRIGKGGAGGSASSSTSADANVDVQPPRDWSAAARERLTLMYSEAREQHLPLRPIARRVAEGRAKGAGEAAILASAGNVKAELSAAQETMVSAGREHPSDGELQGAATAMERGVSRAQLSELARHMPADRSLVVALDVVGKLTARGVPATDAMAQVESKIDAGASDASIGTLAANVGATAGGTVGATGSTAGTAGAASGMTTGSAAASANGAANAAGRGVAGSVTGAVAGTVKKP